MEVAASRCLSRSLPRMFTQSVSPRLARIDQSCLCFKNTDSMTNRLSFLCKTLQRDYSTSRIISNKFKERENQNSTKNVTVGSVDDAAEKALGTPVVKPFENTYEESSLEMPPDRLPMIQLRNKPFLKNLFVGIFDTDMLTYPEVEHNSDLENLESFCKPYEDLFASAETLFEKTEIPIEFVTAMADVGLFAQGIPKKYGGLGLNSTYLTRMSDITGSIPRAQNYIEVHHNIATRLIVDNGTEQQKEKYLPKLATGEMLATLCLHESKSCLDFQNLKTHANFISDADPDNDGFTLNGGKTWVANANLADLFLVVASSPINAVDNSLVEGEDKAGVSMFIVESAKSGVSVSDRIDYVESPRGLPLHDVSFKSVSLDKGDLLGKAGQGDLMTISGMTSSAHHVGSSTASLLKKFTNMLQYFLTREKVADVPLYENQAYQATLADLQMTAYVMESMAYMTGQIMDEFEEPDLSVEQASTRIWCVENLHTILASVMEVLGIGAMEKGTPIMNAYMDTLALKIYPIPLDLMKQYVALSGIRHVISEKGEIHRNLRDYMNNPGTVIKRMFMAEDVPGSYHLHKYVHEVFQNSIDMLEKSCYKFDKAVEAYIVQGPSSGSFLQDQMELNRIASIVSQLYAMTCTVAHASRSACLGLRYADQECAMAQMFVVRTCLQIDHQIEFLKRSGPTGAYYFEKMAKDIIEAKEYLPRHPLTRPF